MDDLQKVITAYINSLQTTEWLDGFFTKLNLFLSSIPLWDIQAILTSAATSFALIFAAEMGDKSQLVCMALAAKHRPMPVVFGALVAFSLLNGLAVIFGKVIANWFPEYVIALAVALLFIVFGLQALRTTVDDPHEEFKEKSGHGIFFTTFLLITLAEFGDKTQLAVVALSSTSSPMGVWLGATLALGMTSALGVLAGRRLLQRIPLELLHKIGGIIFLMLAIAALGKAYQVYFGG